MAQVCREDSMVQVCNLDLKYKQFLTANIAKQEKNKIDTIFDILIIMIKKATYERHT